ncbi:hypothetical protein [Micromonospora deserti]|uniref:SbtR family transcriptional regulator n=1 Tax=Micromonospora deserti TaxID=2070366 RepID=UPI0034DDBB5E
MLVRRGRDRSSAAGAFPARRRGNAGNRRQDAGAGVGTLYRHVPAGSAGRGGVRNELAKLCDAAEELLAALTRLLDAGAAAGTLRADVPRATCWPASAGCVPRGWRPAQRELADRLLDLLMDGLRYQWTS